jgi:hypothetical protein
MCVGLHIHTLKYYSAIRKNEIISFAGKWMELETIMLSETSQTQQDRYHIIILICRTLDFFKKVKHIKVGGGLFVR